MESSYGDVRKLASSYSRCCWKCCFDAHKLANPLISTYSLLNVTCQLTQCLKINTKRRVFFDKKTTELLRFQLWSTDLLTSELWIIELLTTELVTRPLKF